MVLQIPSDSFAGAGLPIRRRAALRSGNTAPADGGNHFVNDDVTGAERRTGAEAVKMAAERSEHLLTAGSGGSRSASGGVSQERRGEVEDAAHAIGARPCC